MICDFAPTFNSKDMNVHAYLGKHASGEVRRTLKSGRWMMGGGADARGRKTSTIIYLFMMVITISLGFHALGFYTD